MQLLSVFSLIYFADIWRYAIADKYKLKKRKMTFFKEFKIFIDKNYTSISKLVCALNFFFSMRYF